MKGHCLPRIHFAPTRISPMRMTLSPHSLLVDECPVYLWNACVSRCLVLVMLSIAALDIDRPQRRSMTTVRQASLVHLIIEKRRTAALALTELLRFFAKKHTRLQLFCGTIKLSVNICFQRLRPPFYFFCPPWWRPLATRLDPGYS